MPERPLHARELIDALADLFSLPAVRRRLVELLDGRAELDATVRAEIAAIISHDPALTARLLRLANATPQLVAPIDGVEAALACIGDEGLRALVATTRAIETFGDVVPELVDMDDFWNHSVGCGLAARILAERSGCADPDRAFLAGALHDIGQLVIYQAAPGLARRVLERAGDTELYRYRAEQEILGLTHAEVGAELLSDWGLPDYLVEAVRWHHEPERAERHPAEAALAHIATGAVNRIDPSWKMDLAQRESVAGIRPHAWAVTGLTADDIGPILAAVDAESIGTAYLIDPRSMLIV